MNNLLKYYDLSENELNGNNALGTSGEDSGAKKYEGMNSVTVSITPAENILAKNSPAKKNKSSKSGIFARFAVCAVIGLILFAGKLIPLPFYNEVKGAVKEIVCFNFIEFIISSDNK